MGLVWELNLASGMAFIPYVPSVVLHPSVWLLSGSQGFALESLLCVNQSQSEEGRSAKKKQPKPWSFSGFLTPEYTIRMTNPWMLQVRYFLQRKVTCEVFVKITHTKTAFHMPNAPLQMGTFEGWALRVPFWFMASAGASSKPIFVIIVMSLIYPYGKVWIFMHILYKWHQHCLSQPIIEEMWGVIIPFCGCFWTQLYPTTLVGSDRGGLQYHLIPSWRAGFGRDSNYCPVD